MTEEQNNLILENIKLVPFVYNKKLRLDELAIRYKDDLFSEGYIGLVKAAKTFNLDKAKFTTYAIMCIKNQMLMFFRQLRKLTNEDSLDTEIFNTDGDSCTKLDELSTDDLSIEDAFILNEQLQEFYNFLKTIKPKYAEIMQDKLNGKTQDATAKKFKLSQSYVARVCNAIRQSFKLYLKEIEDGTRQKGDMPSMWYKDREPRESKRVSRKT